MSLCKHCNGTRRQYVESGSSLCYSCPDCDGTGIIPECDVCGHEYHGEYCEECYEECAECGKVTDRLDLIDGLCPDCEWERQQRKGA